MDTNSTIGNQQSAIETLITCAHCGDEMDPEESLGAEVGPKGQWADVCQDCYHEIVETCQLCGDADVMPSGVSEYILIKAVLSGSHVPPGIFRVLRRPFILQPLIGSGSLCADDVLFIDKLPQPDAHYEISGHICHRCAAPYHRTYARAYRIRPRLRRLLRQFPGAKGERAKWHAVLQHTRDGWEITRQHTRKVILAHPDMLRDLECDPDGLSEFADLKKIYDLPDLPTYHEWLFLEHKGVRVFRCYESGTSWLTLRPDPRYRYCCHTQDGFTFAASGLPTWKSDSADYKYEHPVEDRRAVIQAIDRGLITPEGLKTA